MNLNPDQLEKLNTLTTLLIEANKTTNLTRITEPQQIIIRHYHDSLIILPLLKKLQQTLSQNTTPSLIDIGSGAGIPAIPLAIALPNWKITSVEATRKKSDFQLLAKKQLNLNNLTIINDRAETIAHSPLHRKKYSAAVARALGPLAMIAELTIPLLTIKGQLFALKGPSVKNELQKANQILKKLAASEISLTPYNLTDIETNFYIASAKKLAPTPQTYPRPFNIIKAEA